MALKSYLKKDICRDVTAVLRQIKGDLLNHVANSEAAPEMRGGCQGIWVVYSQKVEIHVKKQ